MSNSLSKLSRWLFGGLIAVSSAGLAAPLIGQETEQEDRRRDRPGLRDGDRGGPRGDRERGDRERGDRERGNRGPQRRGPQGRPDGPPPGGPEMMMRLPVIAALDADKDGVISKSEIENAAAALRKLDRNDDGKIDAEEMRPRFGGRGFAAGGPPRRGPGERGPGERGPGDRGDRGPERRRPGGDRPDADRPDADRPDADRPGVDRPVAQLGAARLDRIMSQDKDGDGLLSGDEIPQRMAKMAERADKNGDQKLSREEIRNAMMARAAASQRGLDRPGRPRGDGDAPDGEKPKRPPVK